MSETASPSPEVLDPRPQVAQPVSNRGVWIFAGLAAIGGTALFAALEARRNDVSTDPLIPAQVAGEAMIAPPPPLAIPDAPQGSAVAASWPTPLSLPTVATPRPLPAAPRQAAPLRASERPAQQPFFTPGSAQPASPSGPAIVYQAAPAPPQNPVAATRSTGEERVKAGRFEHPATTIPQGAVIQAVLETALDSTRPGAARAIVSRDVRSFDGSRVLIPRGSRLYGEYKADLALGQNRALIQWTRLMRPDGVVVALDSPSADPLGRAGVKGKVNSHFLQRFGGALLQSVLDIGVGLATRDIADGTVIVGLPGSTQSVTAPIAPEQVRPTLKVAQGSPVSVFVARDLDFTEVER